MNDISDDTALAILAIGALNSLNECETCCPACCWPCDVLKRLSERPAGAGSLDSILAAVVAEVDLRDYVWATEDGGVDREWLEEVWTRTECTQCHEETAE